jgi:hypothetical protein
MDLEVAMEKFILIHESIAAETLFLIMRMF